MENRRNSCFKLLKIAYQVHRKLEVLKLFLLKNINLPTKEFQLIVNFEHCMYVIWQSFFTFSYLPCYRIVCNTLRRTYNENHKQLTNQGHLTKKKKFSNYFIKIIEACKILERTFCINLVLPINFLNQCDVFLY